MPACDILYSLLIVASKNVEKNKREGLGKWGKGFDG